MVGNIWETYLFGENHGNSDKVSPRSYEALPDHGEWRHWHWFSDTLSWEKIWRKLWFWLVLTCFAPKNRGSPADLTCFETASGLAPWWKNAFYFLWTHFIIIIIITIIIIIIIFWVRPNSCNSQNKDFFIFWANVVLSVFLRAKNRAFWCFPSCKKSYSRSCFLVLSFVPKIVLFGAFPRATNRAFWCFPSCQKSCSRLCFLVLSFVPKIVL